MRVNARTRTMNAVEVEVRVDDPRWRAMIGNAEALCRTAIHTVCAAVAAGMTTPSEVSVVLTGDRRIHDLNKTFRGIDRATDVLAFPGLTSEQLARHLAGADPERGFPAPIGDIIVAFDTASGDAGTHGTDLADHLSHLIVHGMLHLLGYDHQTDKEAVAMERLEASLLASLRIADPYDGR